MTARLSAIAAAIVAMTLVAITMRDDPHAANAPTPPTSVSIPSRELAAVATWVGADSTGSTVVVVNGRDAEFVGGVPVPIDVINHTIDCAALARVAEFWRAHDSQGAEAYVAAAQERAAELDCPTPEASVPA